ncbi:hypothetical protein Pla108_10780 [Botrimarina colliarenosi]|uniref:O-antigen ligase-related domain-containing protein n=1 Tax=Botrimarina colliarenosi TaxID=2528001 RepID=A0A5C6APM1_9BACT|nr:O-antigen ligase family protein [Botrimarina colliarenosi]TWU00134.1 hypothetical protein Pla108_10780 [Botrimarina colliarenosi]
MLLLQVSQLEQLSDLAKNQLGLVIFAVIVMAMFGVISTFSEWARCIGLGLMMWLASLERPIETEYYSLEMTRWLQMLSNSSRVLSIGLLGTLVLGGLFARNNDRKQLFSWPLITLVALQLLNCLKMLAQEDVSRFLSTTPTVIAIFLFAAVGFGRVLGRERGIEMLLWGVLLSGFLFVGGTIHELLLNSASVFANNRLYGTTFNPQPAGMMCALLGMIATYLLIHDRRHYLSKPVLLALLVLLGLGLVATGSRTALLSAAVGFAMLLRNKAFISIAVAAVVIYAVLVLANSFEGIQTSQDRLLDTTNTRRDSWQSLIDQFLSNPLFGSEIEGSGTAESSYLGVAARLGIIGIGFLGAFCFATLRMLYQLFRIRSADPRLRAAGDLVTALVVAFATSCFFDAYLFGSISWHMLLLYVALTIGQYLIEKAHQPVVVMSRYPVPTRMAYQ